MMDALSQTVIFNAFVQKEGYTTVQPLLEKLKQQGLNPHYVTMDGHQKVMQAFEDTWPQITIQRCLCHIQREGMRWLRTFPKTQAAGELRALLSKLCEVHTIKERDLFLSLFYRWLQLYRDFLETLPKTSVAFKDLKRTVSLIRHARVNMFHYLMDSKIPATTNLLESFFSRLKADFRRHRGLSESHKQSYLRWYCYYKNQRISNTF